MSIVVSEIKDMPMAKQLSSGCTGHVYIMVDTTFKKGAVVEVGYDICQKEFTLKNAQTTDGIVIPTIDIGSEAQGLGINYVYDKAFQWIRDARKKHLLKRSYVR